MYMPHDTQTPTDEEIEAARRELERRRARREMEARRDAERERRAKRKACREHMRELGKAAQAKARKGRAR